MTQQSTKNLDLSPETILWSESPSIWMHGPAKVFLACLLMPLLIGIPWFVWLRLESRFTVYRLTDQRIIWERGVLTKKRGQTELYRVRDINLVQPWWLRFMGLGNVSLFSSDVTNPDFYMRAIADSAKVADLTRAAVENARNQHGIRAVDFELRQ